MNINLSSQLAAELAERFGYSSWDRYASRGQFLFEGISLEAKRVCDVGCGKGTWAVWCALHGAYSVGLEPEIDGSTSGAFMFFKQTVDSFGLQHSVQCENLCMEDFFPSSDSKFDVIVLYNVINHLVEDAVQRLPEDSIASKVYVEKFDLLRSALNDGGKLILADCARSNFWPKIHLKNPLAPGIEWRKHQDPEVWERLACRSGFCCDDLRWSYLYPFKRLTANRIVAFFTTSDFVMRLRAV